MDVTRLLVIRHGETAWNRDTRIQGHLDIPLNGRGRWQARQLAQALSEETLAAIYCSDLARARETAEAVAQAQNLAVTPTARLRERHFGAFEGKTWSEIETGWPEQALAWRQRVPDFAPAGGETLLQLHERVVAAVTDIARWHPGQQVAVVAHGGVLDVLYRAATGQHLQAPRTWALDNAAVNRLLWSPEGLRLVGWADTGHLQSDPSLDESTS